MELRRRRESAIAADEAFARRLQAEEAMGFAFGDDGAVEDVDGDDDGTMEDGVDAGVMRARRAPGDVLGEMVLGRLFGALAGRAGARGERTTRDDGDASRAGGETRRGLEFEIPIGPNGQSVRFGTNAFGSRGEPLVDALHEMLGTIGHASVGSTGIIQLPRIIDVLNAMQNVHWAGGGEGGGGLSEEQREAMASRAYERQPGETENATCSVCLSQLEDGEQAKTLGCKHVYHPECIDRWLERSRLCPVCKRDVLTGEHEHS